MMKFRYAVLCLTLVAASAMSASGAPVIDDLKTQLTGSAVAPPGSGLLTSVAVPVSSDTQSGPGILGDRLVNVNNLNGSGSASAQIFGDGTLDLATGVGVSSTVTLTYDNFGVLDLTANPGVRFDIIDFNPGGPVGSPEFPEIEVLLDNGGGFTSAGVVDILNTGMLDLLFGATQRDSVQAIQFVFNSPNGADVKLSATDGFEFIDPPGVPEPATMATFGLMGLVGGYVARRKIKAKAVATA